ncbi:hypothetical protein K1T71_015310 [Dendrolimus kikuchii]|nr:hypothetical protein K1T71_015310 [Dendrolimus kikuchii]
MDRVCVSAFFVSSEFESNENDKKRELDEMCEDRDMVELCENVEKTDIFDSEYDQELYEICTMYENLFDSEYDTNLYEICTTIENNVIQSSSHSVQTGQGVFKRSIESDNSNSDAKRQRHDEPSTSTDKLHCETCNILVNRRYFVNHTKSIVHKNNILKSHCSLDNVSVVDSAFGQRIISYKVKNKNQSDSVFQTPEWGLFTFFQFSYLKNHVEEYNFIISQADDLNIFIVSLRDTLVHKISTFEKKDSGWSLTKINFIELNINKYNPLRGNSYIDLPKDIKDKKAVINVNNSDNFCFKWALLSALYPVNKNSGRLSSYTIHSNKLNFHGISFPVKLNDISKIEKQNNLSINVFGLEYDIKQKKHSVVGPLYFTKCRNSTHINLLYLQNGTVGHYCYIKNLSRLVSKQISNTNGVVNICDGCLLRFSTRDRLINHQQHDCSHITTNLPSSEKTLKNWFGQPISTDKLKFDKFQKKY